VRRLQVGPDFRLWHWTCADSVMELADTGELVPAGDKLIFLTSVHHTHAGFPDVGHEPECGELTARFEVMPSIIRVTDWVIYRKTVPEELIFKLELVEGAMPLMWWVLNEPASIRYTPTERG
jgi:hypothetical protein